MARENILFIEEQRSKLWWIIPLLTLLALVLGGVLYTQTFVADSVVAQVVFGSNYARVRRLSSNFPEQRSITASPFGWVDDATLPTVDESLADVDEVEEDACCDEKGYLKKVRASIDSKEGFDFQAFRDYMRNVFDMGVNEDAVRGMLKEFGAFPKARKEILSQLRSYSYADAIFRAIEPEVRKEAFAAKDVDALDELLAFYLDTYLYLDLDKKIPIPPEFHDPALLMWSEHLRQSLLRSFVHERYSDEQLLAVFGQTLDYWAYRRLKERGVVAVGLSPAVQRFVDELLDQYEHSADIVGRYLAANAFSTSDMVTAFKFAASDGREAASILLRSLYHHDPRAALKTLESVESPSRRNLLREKIILPLENKP